MKPKSFVIQEEEPTVAFLVNKLFQILNRDIQGLERESLKGSLPPQEARKVKEYGELLIKLQRQEEAQEEAVRAILDEVSSLPDEDRRKIRDLLRKTGGSSDS